METLLLRLLFFLSFTVVTWFWWKISRRFFIFLFYFYKDFLKIKKNSLQDILFNYGIFGPLGLLCIAGYIYTFFIFLKFSKII